MRSHALAMGLVVFGAGCATNLVAVPDWAAGEWAGKSVREESEVAFEIDLGAARGTYRSDACRGVLIPLEARSTGLILAYVLDEGDPNCERVGTIQLRPEPKGLEYEWFEASEGKHILGSHLRRRP